jgi:Mg/Co/Ni transporter MgtE
MLARIDPADLAAILDELPPEHVADIFHALGDKEMAAEVFNQMPADLRTRGDDRVERQSAGQLARTPAPG